MFNYKNKYKKQGQTLLKNNISKNLNTIHFKSILNAEALLYIREAIIFGDLQNYKTVKWDEIHHGNESDGKETLGDSLTKDSL